MKTFWWCVAATTCCAPLQRLPAPRPPAAGGRRPGENVITCPYHAWAFKLDGELAHARNCENVQNFDKENSHLMPVRVEEYAGFIYVNLDSQAGTVEDQLPGLGAKVREACPQVDDLAGGALRHPNPGQLEEHRRQLPRVLPLRPGTPGFADSVQVDRYWHTLHGNWTLQFGYARPSEQSFKFEEGKASFHGIWLWPCTMFNMPPLEGMMTVIYEFPVDAETTLQHYDIYFTNADLSDEQLKLIDWYRDVFRPEDLRLVESVQKASNRAAIAARAHHGRRRRQRRQRTRHRPLPQSAGAGLSTLMRRGPRAPPLTCEVLCEYFRSGAIPPTSLHQRAMARCRQPGNPAGERSRHRPTHRQRAQHGDGRNPTGDRRRPAGAGRLARAAGTATRAAAAAGSN